MLEFDVKKAGRNIWIINQYATTPSFGYGGRSFYLARNLAKAGHRVSIIAGSANHLMRDQIEVSEAFNKSTEDGINFIWVRLGSYRGARSPKRVMNWFRFAFALRRIPKLVDEKPDVIICSSPSLISWLGAEYLIKYFNSFAMFEVRDIWPLTLMELGGYSPLNPFILFLRLIERRAYSRADRVISNIPHANKHMLEEGMATDKFLWIPNGIDVSEFQEKRSVPKRVQSAIPNEKFVVGYAGSIGEANALECLIEAAKLLDSIDYIHFVLVGNGDKKLVLLEMVKKANLANITFVDAVSKKDVPSTLRGFDALYIGAKPSAIYRFGVAMNKLPEYMMAARPIIYAIDSGEYTPVLDAKCGVQVDPGDPISLASAIVELSKTDAETREKMGKLGHDFALKRHNYEQLAVKLENAIIR